MSTPDWGKPVLAVPCQSLSRAAFAKWQWIAISVPTHDLSPRSPRSLCAQICEGRQTACHALAARHKEMAWCSCFIHWEEHMGWFPTFLRGGCHCWAPRAHRSTPRTHSFLGCPSPHLMAFTLARDAHQHPRCGWILWQGGSVSPDKHAINRKLQPIPASSWAPLTSVWSNANRCADSSARIGPFSIAKSKEIHSYVVPILYQSGCIWSLNPGFCWLCSL